jgi:Vitamin K-dependent gamma-carboxylase
MQLWKQRLIGFLFPDETDTWVTVLRLGLGVQLVLYCLSLRTDWNYLLAGTGRGLISRNVAETIISLESPFIPRLGWLVAIGGRLGLSEDAVLTLAWGCLLCAACCLLVGVLCRPAAIIAWFLHLSAVKSGDLVSYGMDNFTTIGLFYLMLSPLPDRHSLAWQWRKSPPKERYLLGFFRRVLQVHLCLIYFFGGVAKCLGSGWWNGSNLWRALIRPPFNLIDPAMLVRWKFIFPIAGVFICLLELSYPFFIWGRRTRKIWLISICGMHIGIGLTMGMYLFSLVMIILNLAAFGAEFISIPFAKLRLVVPERSG